MSHKADSVDVKMGLQLVSYTVKPIIIMNYCTVRFYMLLNPQIIADLHLKSIGTNVDANVLGI